MSKIYVVTKGCDSDYHIITATPDKELAQKIAKCYTKYLSDGSVDKWEEVNVEEFEDAEDLLKPAFKLIYDKDNNLIDIHNTASYDIKGYSYIFRSIDDGYTIVVVHTDSIKSAIKIGHEKLMMCLATEKNLL